MKNFRLILPLLASFLILAALVPATTVNGAELTAEFQITNLTKKEYQDENKWELYVDEVITFDSSSSTDDVDFIWDFGDGTEKNTTQSITVSHIYKNTGDYTVNLTIRDKNDENKTDSIKGTLLIVKRPKAVLVIRDANTGKPITANQTIAPGQEIIMDASDSEGNIQ